MPDDPLFCFRCQVPLEKAPTNFNYLKHSFTHELPRCPRCGQVYITEELVVGKMQEVETSLEEK